MKKGNGLLWSGILMVFLGIILIFCAINAQGCVAYPPDNTEDSYSCALPDPSLPPTVPGIPEVPNSCDETVGCSMVTNPTGTLLYWDCSGTKICLWYNAFGATSATVQMQCNEN